MMYDPRWHDIAADWLSDSDIPAELVEKYTPKLAQELQDTAESFTMEDIQQLGREADDAAEDMHWMRKIDEARGK